MQRRLFLSYLTGSLCIGPAACLLSGCGTLIHTERVGQPHTHQIDWKIVALDGLGMLLFFVPGVIAFAVDFYTGAIYIPYEEYHGPYPAPGSASTPQPTWGPPPSVPVTTQQTTAAPTPASVAPANGPSLQSAGNSVSTTWSPELGLRRMEVPRDQLDPQSLEQVVSMQIGRPVSLQDPSVRMSDLAQIESFQDQRRTHEEDRSFGSNIRRFFDRFQQA
ncbi:hypothetical protein AB1L30_27345 [Bremerella sp. JC817]|uniref:hypothetical protein n=1 Tax=Bremerella sp. JC817 TaxID=3231756 RepID=UPI00345AA87B